MTIVVCNELVFGVAINPANEPYFDIILDGIELCIIEARRMVKLVALIVRNHSNRSALQAFLPFPIEV